MPWRQSRCKWCDTGSGWAAGEIPACGTNQNGLVVSRSLCQAIVSYLGFRGRAFSGLFPNQTAVASSSRGMRLPLWDNTSNEMENLNCLILTAVEGRCCICFDLPKFVLCVTYVDLLKTVVLPRVESPTLTEISCLCFRSTSAAFVRVALGESSCAALQKTNTFCVLTLTAVVQICKA